MEKGVKQGVKEGVAQGLIKAIKLRLKQKFGTDGLQLLPEISAISNVTRLEKILAAIERADTPDKLRRVYQPTTS